MGVSARMLCRNGLAKFVQAPEDMCCPITCELFVDPVVGSDGHTYERSAIERVLQADYPTSPMTRETLQPIILPNLTLKKVIASRMATVMAIHDATTAENKKRARGGD